MTQVAEATESSLREGIQQLGVKDSEKDGGGEGDGGKEEGGQEGTAGDEKTEGVKGGEKDEAMEEGKQGEEKESDDAETKNKTEGGEEEEEWEIAYSDEEMDDPKNWMPPPPEIKRLYELLSKGEKLELEYIPLPRRPPTPERTPSPDRDEEEEAVAREREREEREKKPPTPTEFDFDETQATPKNAYLNRRRTPGSSARSSVKREARLDKVLSDMKRHRKMEEHILRTGKDLFKSEKSSPIAPPEEALSPNSQKEREKERERDRHPSTIFSPRQRRY